MDWPARLVLAPQSRSKARRESPDLTTRRNAQAFLADARLISEEAQQSFEKEHYHRVVRQCQEAAELALKGYLLFAGITYPRTHDVGLILTEAVLKRHPE
jgi:HEPN domain-containing protein